MSWKVWPRSRSVIGIEFTKDGFRGIALSDKGGRLRTKATILEETDHPFDLLLENEPLNLLVNFVKENKLQGSEVVLSAPNDKVVVRYMQLPKLPAKALRQAVEVGLGTSIHLPFEDPVFEISPVACINAGELRDGFQPMCLVASPRDEIERMVSLVRAAGLQPTAIDISPFAVVRSCGVGPVDSDGLTCLVQVDADGVAMSIFIRGQLYFFRTIEIPVVLDDKNDSGAAFVNDMGYEFERVINFFNFNLSDRERAVERILLHSSAGNVQGLAENLAMRLGSDVQALTASSQVRCEDRYVSAVGLALKGSGGR